MDNPSADGQSKPGNSNTSSNTRTSEHEEIALLFRMATDKLDQVETNAKKEKQQIVRDLARDLEKFLPIDRIASEIVEELREKVSKSVVYAALDERYKTSYRVQNARKRKKEKEKKADSLAPTSELKQVIIDTSGHSTQQLVSEADSSDDYDNNKPLRQITETQDSRSGNVNETEKVESSNASVVDTDASQTSKQNEATRYFSHISMPFERLRRDMYAVAQRTNGMGDVFWKLSINFTTRLAEIEFCGITQQKDVTMISTGKGILREAN
jgi:hypothetical protein